MCVAQLRRYACGISFKWNPVLPTSSRKEFAPCRSEFFSLKCNQFRHSQKLQSHRRVIFRASQRFNPRQKIFRPDLDPNCLQRSSSDKKKRLKGLRIQNIALIKKDEINFKIQLRSNKIHSLAFRSRAFKSYHIIHYTICNISRCNKRTINKICLEAKYLMMKGRIMFVLMVVGSSNPGQEQP